MRGSGGRIHVRTVGPENRLETPKVNAARRFKLRQSLGFAGNSIGDLLAWHLLDFVRPMAGSGNRL
jgi:hypothetical protein